MQKKIVGIFFILMLALSGIIILINMIGGIRNGFRSEWTSQVFLNFPTGTPPEATTKISIEGQTTDSWSVMTEFSTLYGPLSDYSETISKAGSRGGFVECSGMYSGYWLLWIDPKNVSETSALSVPGNLVGIYPFESKFWIEGPFTFEVEEGLFEHTDYSLKAIWIYSAENLTIIYEKYTGILLHLFYLEPDSTDYWAVYTTLEGHNY